jgi:uncharacterized protein YndB with AHSA1/START domain
MTNETKHEVSITTPDDLTIRMEREFDYPRELVWEAYTEPELLAQWLGPHGTNMQVEADVREGGTYTWVEGEYRFWGEYREVSAPEVLESTFEFSGAPGHQSVDRLELEELEGGRTRAVATSSFDSKEDRDAALQSGMEKGVIEGYEKMDAVLERLSKRS